MVKKNKPVNRLDPDFELDMRSVARERLNKGLARLTPRDLSMAEMTRLLRRTSGYQISLRELKTKPKRITL